jgi:hypothetical protein
VTKAERDALREMDCLSSIGPTMRALLDALDDADAVIKAARAWKESAYGLKADDDLFRAVIAYDQKHGGGG